MSISEIEDLVLTLLRELPLTQAALLLLSENLLIFIGSTFLGNLLMQRYMDRRVAPTPPPIETKEIVYTASTILINTAVTLLGLWLWRAGFIRFRNDLGFFVLFDIGFLLLVMDTAMYAMHRVAHISWVYLIVHKTHHRYDSPRPLSLFVLNPFEAMGFGSLWLLVLCIYDSSWLGMAVYLVLNVIFGVIGHLGVEPFSASWLRMPILRWLTTSTFHAQHHQYPDFNFGFYTLIWDRVFGTLTPQYDTAFGTIPDKKNSG